MKLLGDFLQNRCRKTSFLLIGVERLVSVSYDKGVSYSVGVERPVLC